MNACWVVVLVSIGAIASIVRCGHSAPEDRRYREDKMTEAEKEILKRLDRIVSLLRKIEDYLGSSRVLNQ